MRLLYLFQKSMKENLRDWKILILTLSFAPFFAIVMYFYLGDPSSSYNMVVVNHDRGVRELRGNILNAGNILTSHLNAYTDPQGDLFVKVRREKTVEEAKQRLIDRSADLIVEIPQDFSFALLEYRHGKISNPTTLTIYGDSFDSKSSMALVWCDYFVFQFLKEFTELEEIIKLDIKFSEETPSSSAFDLYVPVLLALAIMMLMFTTAATLIKEKDKRTIIRLRLSNMTTFEWLATVTISQNLIGMGAVALTYTTALALGYQSEGSLLAISVVGVLSCLALVGISVILAAWLRTVFDLMTIGCFPFFILMFFSGGMMPASSMRLFHFGQRTLYINDILPTTHSITAFEKILNQGAGLEEITFEMGAITILAVVYFLTGIRMFTRRHMSIR